MATSLEIDEALKQPVQSVADQQHVGTVEARASFEAEANASWLAYHENGLHVTRAELCDWLAGWTTEAETGAPECHE